MTVRSKVSRWLAGAVLACAAAPAHASVQRLLIDRELVAREVSILSIDADAVEIAHPDRSSEPIPMDDIAAILPIKPAARPRLAAADAESPGAAHAIVVMTDGQRLIGRIGPEALDRPAHGAAAAEDALPMRLDAVGAVVVALDRIARVELAPDAPSLPAEAARDSVVLRNGDAVTGYLLAMAGDHVEIETDTGTVTLPIDGIAAITLANPPRVPTSTLVSLADGSVLEVAGITTGSGGNVGLTLTLAGPGTEAGSESDAHRATRAVELEQILGLVPAATGARSLASLPAPEHEPTGGRRWAPAPVTGPPAVGGFRRIELPGPMAATWDLPRGTARFAARATLGHAPGPWADCELVVRVETTTGRFVLATHRLRAGEPHADVRVDLPAGARALTIAVLPGEGGPVQDRVFLERPMILVGR